MATSLPPARRDEAVWSFVDVVGLERPTTFNVRSPLDRALPTAALAIVIL